jgi:hemolysin III
MAERTWWHRENRPFDREEKIVDAAVHVSGLVLGAAGGIALLVLSIGELQINQVLAFGIYLVSLLTVLAASLAFNLWPVTPVKRHLARLDQAAIFFFVAGSYTAFLALVGNTFSALLALSLVWTACIIGIALKLLAPERFGRIAIAMFLAIGWSALLLLDAFVGALTPLAIWLIIAGGCAYSIGIIFHLWEKLRFQNAVWHFFVVAGALLHLGAILHSVGAAG